MVLALERPFSRPDAGVWPPPPVPVAPVWRVRRVNPHVLDDVDLLYRLRREPSVAARLFAPPPPTFVQHARWVQRACADGAVLLLLIQEKPPAAAWGSAGWLRFTVQRGEPGRPVDVSVALLPEARGRGLAALALRGVCPLVDALRRSAGPPRRVLAPPPPEGEKGARLEADEGGRAYEDDPFWRAGPIRARIKPGNAASLATFARAGFVGALTTAGWVEVRYGK